MKSKLLSVSLSLALMTCLCPGLALADSVEEVPANDSVLVAQATGGQSMYRLYNPNSGEHFYTADASERNDLVRAGWVYEGVGWTAPKSSKTPVYRLYSGTDHHYTMDASERDMLKRAGWRYEGIGWYSDDAKGVPLYRQFNPNVVPTAPRNNSGSHNYTKDLAEHKKLVSIGWKGEGVGWYGVRVSNTNMDKTISVKHDSSKASISSFKSPWSIIATGPGHPKGKYTEQYLFDRNINTRWFYTGDDSGTGESIKINIGKRAQISGLAIWNGGSGNLKDGQGINNLEKYNSRGRLKLADVYAGSEYIATYSFAELDLDACILAFPHPITTDTVTIKIKEVVPGTLGAYCTLREIAYF